MVASVNEVPLLQLDCSPHTMASTPSSQMTARTQERRVSSSQDSTLSASASSHYLWALSYHEVPLSVRILASIVGVCVISEHLRVSREQV